jgi:serine protease Do
VDYLRANVPGTNTADARTGTDGNASNPVAAALQLQEAFADIAARVFPNVVGVWSYERDPAPVPTPTKSTSGSWTASAPDAPVYPGFRALRSGTGFMLDDDNGYILSRDFLVRNDRGDLAQFVSIELSDGSNRLGRIVGTEPTLDFAVLQLADTKAIPVLAKPLEIGNSDSLKAGHWIIALGDPPGVERTFAVGTVSSGPARQCYQDRLSATLIQGSITVPPAGLGGPVVDILGRVVGVSVSPRSQLYALAALFAEKTPSADTPPTPPTRVLPINLAMTLFNALIIAKSHESPWIGISVLELQSYRRQFPSQQRDVPSSGVYIDNVFDPSPASRGGVRLGDFLLELNGHRVGSVSDFQTWMYVLGIGTPCDLKLMRDGKPMNVTVTIESRAAAAKSS